MGRGRRWTKQEEQALLHGVGIYGVSWFQNHTGDGCDWPGAPKGRTRQAVYHKARRLYGAGGLTRGVYTLRRLSRETGYGVSHFRRAMRACAQKWKRTSPRGRFLICEDQADELIAWLRGDYWGKRHRLYNCSWCGSLSRVHYAQGLCLRCYQRYTRRLSRAGLPIRGKELTMVLKRWSQQTDRCNFLEIATRFSARGRAIPEITLHQILRVWHHAG